MKSEEQLTFLSESILPIGIRQRNILRSPKRNGNAEVDSQPYLKELGVELINNVQPIQFFKNTHDMVHRWSPYVQGFSSKFVQNIFDQYKQEYNSPIVFDPFLGSGTVLVQAKLNHYNSYGVELNPLLHFIAETKTQTWQVNPERLEKISHNLRKTRTSHAPVFLKSDKHFKQKVLENLEIVKSGIDNFIPDSSEDKLIKDLMTIAFSSILIECSNLKRTPCLGYSKSKVVDDDAPLFLFRKKIHEISTDLRFIQSKCPSAQVICKAILANSESYEHQSGYDLVITSPPYMNGLDYVINYKIEMGWLGFADNHKQLKRVKDTMVVCDNVSKGLIRDFSKNKERYNNSWISDIKSKIILSIIKRGNYRRADMPEIVHKYFDDMYNVMSRVIPAINPGGRFILVVGDSLIADVYLPTDLILAKIGMDLGLTIEKIEKARKRRSGQIRSYELRESIITLRKD